MARILLLFFWIIAEFYRLGRGYRANLDESFPQLMSFDLVTLVFCLSPQIILIIGDHVLPVDIVTTVIYIIFVLFEFIFSLFAMRRIIKSKGSLYYLRNTATKIISSEDPIKSSKEIEYEVFARFPHLRSQYTERPNGPTGQEDLNSGKHKKD